MYTRTLVDTFFKVYLAFPVTQSIFTFTEVEQFGRDGLCHGCSGIFSPTSCQSCCFKPVNVSPACEVSQPSILDPLGRMSTSPILLNSLRFHVSHISTSFHTPARVRSFWCAVGVTTHLCEIQPQCLCVQSPPSHSISFDSALCTPKS